MSVSPQVCREEAESARIAGSFDEGEVVYPLRFCASLFKVFLDLSGSKMAQQPLQ